MLLTSHKRKACRQWDGEEEKREREKERERERENIKNRLLASARRAWPATAAEVVKRLVLTTSASKLCDEWLAFEIAKKRNCRQCDGVGGG